MHKTMPSLQNGDIIESDPSEIELPCASYKRATHVLRYATFPAAVASALAYCGCCYLLLLLLYSLLCCCATTAAAAAAAAAACCCVQIVLYYFVLRLIFQTQTKKPQSTPPSQRKREERLQAIGCTKNVLWRVRTSCLTSDVTS